MTPRGTGVPQTSPQLTGRTLVPHDLQPTLVAAPWPDPPQAGPPTPTQPIPVTPARPARHMANGGQTGRGRSRPNDHETFTAWMKIAVPALAAVVVLMTAGVLVTLAKDGGSEQSASAAADPAPSTPATSTTTDAPAVADDDLAAPAPVPATDLGTEPTPTTTTGTAPAPAESLPPADSAPPPSDDPLAACSEGQRNMIERGNHPWEWYLARFDENGDGVLCT